MQALGYFEDLEGRMVLIANLAEDDVSLLALLFYLLDQRPLKCFFSHSLDNKIQDI